MTIQVLRKCHPLASIVLRQLGETCGDEAAGTLRNVREHGADGGFSGFIYYADTCRFYSRNRSCIVAQLVGDAADYGYPSSVALVASFRSMDGVSHDDIARTMHGRGPADDTVANALAWYALETVAAAAEEGAK